jgi:hypothetical protein
MKTNKDLTNLFATIFTFTQWFKDGSKVIIKGIDIQDALTKAGYDCQSPELDYYRIGIE